MNKSEKLDSIIKQLDNAKAIIEQQTKALKEMENDPDILGLIHLAYVNAIDASNYLFMSNGLLRDAQKTVK